MALTRKLLKDMQLNDETIEQIIAAHAATVEALKAERDAAASELEALRSAEGQSAAEVQAAFDAYRSRVENDQNTAKARELLRLAMIQAGCNQQVIDLLIQTVDPAKLALEGGSLKDEGALIAGMKEKHAAFFAQPTRMSVPSIQPPIPTGGALTREDLSRMSADEINRNWNAVKSVLSKGAI